MNLLYFGHAASSKERAGQSGAASRSARVMPFISSHATLPWSRTMEKLRHGPENLTCHSERTGFYSEGVWCAATLHWPADVSSHARPAILMVHGWGGIQNAMTVPFYEEFTRAGHVVMTFDYRGWGESAGLPRQTISARQRMRDADA